MVVKPCLWIKKKNGGAFLTGMTIKKTMASVKKKITVDNPKCCVCNKEARIYYLKNWWCASQSCMGNFNLKGYCKEKK